MYGPIGLNKTNMELFKRYKLAILGGLITIALFVIYSVYFTNDNSASLTQEGGANVAADTELLTLLLSLQSITLDDAIFSSPEFRSLIDLGKEISPEPIGRANPFRPI